MWLFTVSDWLLHIWPKQAFWLFEIRRSDWVMRVWWKKTKLFVLFWVHANLIWMQVCKIFMISTFWHLLYQPTMFTNTINKRLPPFHLIWFVNDFVWSVRPDSLPRRRAGQEVCSSFDWASQMMPFAFLTHHFGCLHSTTLPHIPSRDVMPSSQ